MASTQPLKNKDGRVYAYQIKVFRGRDANKKQLKPYSEVWRIPEGMNHPRTIKKELEKEAARFELECKAGVVPLEKKTFSEYADYVMTLKKRDQKRSTVTRYEELLVRIKEEIGPLKLADVTGEHLNRFYLKLSQPGQNKKTGGGLSPKTILEYHRLIHTIYAQALKEGLVMFNTADKATPPAVRKKEAEFFEVEEVQKIMSCLAKEPLKWQTITQLLIASGARRGEIMGLKWSAVDFKNNRIKIAVNLLYDAKLGIYEDTSKTEESRQLAIDPSVMKLLALHKKEQMIQRLKLGDQWVDGNYCFTQANGKPMHPDSITDWLSKFSKKYDLPHIHPHKFRHTQASILIYEGVDPVTVSKRLGHKKVSTTENIYAHIMSKADAEASAAVASVLYKNQKKA